MFLRGLVSVLKGKVFSLFSFRRRVLRRRASIAGLVLALVVGLGVATTGPASAVEPIRLGPMVVGGTELQFPSGTCTAGLVMVNTRWWNNITAYQRNTRYVLTAGHCGNEGDRVSLNGQRIGSVYWKNQKPDMMVVQVKPTVTSTPHCTQDRSGFHCILIYHSAPRASGRVITYVPRLREFGTVPVAIWWDGAPERSFNACVSGAISSFSCGWRNYTLPHDAPAIPGQRAMLGTTVVAAEGDSGAPVFSNPTDDPNAGVTVYGIVLGGFRPPISRNAMRYLTAGVFFTEWEWSQAYALAPA